MPWVHRVPIEDDPDTVHKCEPPMRQLVPSKVAMSANTVPDGGWGSLWRCGTCGKLWAAWSSRWREAGLIDRIIHYRRGRD
jgi:hypothetical protein